MGEHVQFDEYNPVTYKAEPERGGLVGFLLKSGWVKSERQAFQILLGVAILGVVLVIGIMFMSGGDGYVPEDSKPSLDDSSLPPHLR